MAYEIEKKFLILNNVDLDSLTKPFETVKIMQAYLEMGNTERRVRSCNNKYYYTVKSNIENNLLIRNETEIEITKAEFETKLTNHIGNVVHKLRTKIPLNNNLFAEVDVYLGKLYGLRVVEVEFANKKLAETFCKPDWFGCDVTYNSQYKNQSLAINGYPNDYFCK